MLPKTVNSKLAKSEDSDEMSRVDTSRQTLKQPTSRFHVRCFHYLIHVIVAECVWFPEVYHLVYKYIVQLTQIFQTLRCFIPDSR